MLGVSADKDRAGILKALARWPRGSTSRPRTTRGRHPAELVDSYRRMDAASPLTAGSEEALERPRRSGTDVVCVAGSLFLVADALRWLDARGLLDAG